MLFNLFNSELFHTSSCFLLSIKVVIRHVAKTLILSRGLGRKSNSLLILKLLRNRNSSKGSSNSRRFKRTTLVY